MMAWSLTAAARAELRSQFEEMDINNDGTITLNELKQVLEDKFHVESHEADALFKRMDSDCDDKISYSEFLAATLQSRVGMNEDILRSTFKRFDVDGNGQITAGDLREILGDVFEGAKIEELVQEADTDGSGTISYDEYLAYLHEG